MDWRNYGNVSRDLWSRELRALRSPIADEAEAAYEAAYPHTALALAMAYHESKYGTAFFRNSARNRNALNLRPRGADGFQAFSSWAEGFAEWRARVTDLGYAYAKTKTLAELVSVFAPASDDNDEGGYVRTVSDLLAEWQREEQGSMERAATRPTIFVTAGHRSDGDTGNPEEKKRTPAMARAYRDAFQAAGYTVHYWQSEDGDNRPDQSPGGLDAVGSGVAKLMAATPGPLVLFDCHFEGSPSRGVFAIVPDTVGLSTRVPNGAPADDTWTNNAQSVRLARLLSKNIAGATGIPLRATTEPGVMSERATGVATAYKARLAMFAYTAPLRARAVRLVVEHGNLSSAADLAIIDKPGFYEKCARAAVAAVADVYAIPPAPSPELEYAAPGPIPAAANGEDAAVSGVWFYAISRLVTAREGAAFRQYADVTSKETRAPAKKGETFAVAWTIQSPDGEWWYVTPKGSRIRQSDCNVRATIVRA